MTIIFMAISSMLLVLTVLLFTNLLCSIDDLMATAKTPDFLQMHTGELDESQLHRFALAHSEVREWQICKYLNLENSSIYLGNYSLADSTQDNGLCVQGEKFDYLLSTENHVLIFLKVKYMFLSVIALSMICTLEIPWKSAVKRCTLQVSSEIPR